MACRLRLEVQIHNNCIMDCPGVCTAHCSEGKSPILQQNDNTRSPSLPGKQTLDSSVQVAFTRCL
eukprot:5794225-Amphidinium_carterae.2